MNWRETQVSPDRSHHLLDGRPCYSNRFLEVLKFHAPGLAPVLTHTGATHIDSTGIPAYTARYTRTFGFYEDRAAVDAAGEWFHILPGGEALSTARYAWCGNFQQGRCTVRDTNARYFHIDLQGRPAYDERRRYAGDFRDGVAVVQREDGLHIHVDREGRPLHTGAYEDLDVFHKHLARARDRDGWMHINVGGQPIYGRRFRMVEPFYNGQARVERCDGVLEVIDECGQALLELGPARAKEVHHA